MRIAVEHRTRYRFAEPQARIIELLRLIPSDTLDQTVVAWRVDVDCDARLRQAEDGFGNETMMLYAEGPLDTIEVAVTGEVLITDCNGVVREAPEPLPPLFFLRTTPRTTPDKAIVCFAQDAVGDGSVLDRLHRLNTALHARFAVAAEERDSGRTASEVFQTKQASPRDVAHVFIAAARGLAMPARYVSGYRQGDGARCAPHAWVEAYVDGLGWVAFDPGEGMCTDDHYVRVAVGLDSAGAAMVTGQRIGAGTEALDVDVQVDRLGDA